jgi:hypothetical protein
MWPLGKKADFLTVATKIAKGLHIVRVTPEKQHGGSLSPLCSEAALVKSGNCRGSERAQGLDLGRVPEI